MEPFRYHVFVCNQVKPEGVAGCAAQGAGEVIEALNREIEASGLTDAVQVTICGSLGLCEHGPNLVVYPEGIWYSGLTPLDVAEIFDLPTVIPIAQGHVNAAGLSDRITARAGDLRVDELGRGYDLVFVSAICHMLDPDENRDLLDRAFRALIPRGRIVIQDFILEPDKTAPKSAALFALNMLVGTQQGSSYSAVAYTNWPRKAGFDEVRHVRLPGPSGLMMAVRPV